jgi:gluconolactonase
MMLERFEEFVDGLNHPEGVAWNPFDGCVYAGGEGGELYRIPLDGDVQLLGSSGGGMLGLCVDGRGRVYGCDAGRGEVVRIDPTTGAIETYARGVGGKDLDTPNVAAFDAAGNLYVTCSGEDGRPEIVVVHPGGPAERWTDALPGYPNGCVVSPDGSAVLVVEAKAERVARVGILPDGSAGRPETLVDLPDTDADGLAMDAAGGLWATLYRPDGLVRITQDGRIDLTIDDHLASTFDAPTNIAFVGPRLERAVVANVGGRHLSIADLDVAGQPLHYPEVP